jgi:hypothetical protein
MGHRRRKEVSFFSFAPLANNASSAHAIHRGQLSQQKVRVMTTVEEKTMD